MLSLVSSLGNEAEDGDVIELSPEAAEAVKNSMERYIKER
jgi:hypothetical protein